MSSKSSLFTAVSVDPFRLIKRLLCLLVLVSLQGCVSSVKYGILPDVSKLDQLKQGISTKSDVLLLLGEPRGKGKSKFAASIPYPFDIWLYEYTQLDGKNIDFKFLLIFLDKDLYEGYFWFSSKDLASAEIQ